MAVHTSETKTVMGACPQDCPDTCAFLYHVEDGKLVEVGPNPDHPMTRGGLCVKLKDYAEHHYNPDRLLYPMKRIGPKGSHVLNVRRALYVQIRDQGGLDPELGHGFNFFFEDGELLAAYTDGINECHYRSPATSVGMPHLNQTFAKVGPQPEAFSRELIQLSLTGVDGNPGGQDNIAIAVTMTGMENEA